jgi:hypothetical protein
MYLRSLVGGRYFHDTVGIHLKGDFDLGNTTRSRRNTSEFELAEEVVVLGERTFTLEDLNKNGRLVVGSGGEDLALLGGDDSVAGNELGENSTSGLDTESEGVDVDKDNTICSLSTRKNATLDSSTVGNSFVRVDSLGRFLAVEEILEELLNLGDTSRATNEHDL